MTKIEKLGIIAMLASILLSVVFGDWPFVFLFTVGAYMFQTNLDLFSDEGSYLIASKLDIDD